MQNECTRKNKKDLDVDNFAMLNVNFTVCNIEFMLLGKLPGKNGVIKFIHQVYHSFRAELRIRVFYFTDPEFP